MIWHPTLFWFGLHITFSWQLLNFFYFYFSNNFLFHSDLLIVNDLFLLVIFWFWFEAILLTLWNLHHFFFKINYSTSLSWSLLFSQLSLSFPSASLYFRNPFKYWSLFLLLITCCKLWLVHWIVQSFYE